MKAFIIFMSIAIISGAISIYLSRSSWWQIIAWIGAGGISWGFGCFIYDIILEGKNQ